MKTKYAIALSVIILATTIFLLIDLHNSAEKEVKSEFQVNQLFTANQLSKGIKSCLTDEAHETEMLATDPNWETGNVGKVSEAAINYFKYSGKKYLNGIGIYDSKGTLIYSTFSNAQSTGQINSNLLKWASKKENKGEQYVTRDIPNDFILFNKKSLNQVIIIAPVYKRNNNQFTGIVVSSIDLDKVIGAFFAEDGARIKNKQAWVLDNEGTVVSLSSHPEMVNKDIRMQDNLCFECHSSFNYVKTIISKSTGSAEYNLAGSPEKLSSFVTLNFKNISWKIVVNTPLSEITSFVNKNGNKTLLLLIVIIIILIGFYLEFVHITKLKAKAETESEKLKVQQELNLILESAGEGIMGIDTNADHIFINPKAAELLGYEPEELIGMNSHKTWHHSFPDGSNYPIEDCPISYTLKDGVKHTGEESFWRKNGTYFPVHFTTTPIKAGDKVTGAVITFSDITKQKEYEKTITETLSMWQTTFDGIDNSIFLLDQEGIILRSNDISEKFFGKNNIDIIGHSCHEIVHRNNCHINGCPFVRMKMSHQRETIILPFDNKYLEIIVYPIFDKDNKVTGAVHIANDITERKRIELEQQVLYEIAQGVTITSNSDELMILIHQALKKVIYSENIFIALYDEETNLFRFPYFIDKFDPTPEPTAMNKSCTSYVFHTGVPLLLTQEFFEELVERDLVELVGTHSPSWLGVPLKSPSRTIGVLVIQHYEEKNVYSENDVKFLESVGGQIAMVIERKLAEEEINIKNAQLKRTNSEKDKFFSIIAHDLRSPFSGFLQLTSIMEKEIESLTAEDLAEVGKELHKSASTVYKLLENLLQWAQMQKGSISFDPVELVLKDALDFCISAIKPRAMQKGIIIINEIPDTKKIIADEKMINSVIRNYLSNAVKFTNKDGKIIVRCFELKDNMTAVSVTDTGIGMEQRDVTRLFKMEEKVSSKGTDGEPSTGLGLLLCKEFVEKQGGKVWAESEKGKGSTFYFSVPGSKI